MNHPLIIGAGGVASYLLPVLLKTSKPEKLTIVDKDVLEERNLDRQMFDKGLIGKNKAEALISTVLNIWPNAQGHNVFTQGNLVATFIPQWFELDTEIPEDVDAIICCADNHMARYAAIQRALNLGITAYIGGNEYFDSQAFIANRALMGTPRDPLIRYPNIATDETGSPTSCQGAAQEASPQLAIANMSCAAKLLHLLWIYEKWLPGLRGEKKQAEIDEIAKHLPVELFSSLTDNNATI